MVELSKRVKDLVFPPRGNLLRLRFRERDRLTALVPDDEAFALCRELILQRVYDAAGIPSGTVVDAGAHVGLFSLIASSTPSASLPWSPTSSTSACSSSIFS